MVSGVVSGVCSPQQERRCPSCVSTRTCCLSPLLLPRGWDLRERHKQVGEGRPLLSQQRWPWVATCPPDMGNPSHKAVPASPEGRIIAARARGDRRGRASTPFPVPEESCSSPRPAAFSLSLPPPPWLSFLGASQPHDATLGCVWT